MVDSITIRFNYDRHGNENNTDIMKVSSSNSNSNSTSNNNNQRQNVSRMRNDYVNASSGYSSRGTSVHELQTARSSPIDDDGYKQYDKQKNDYDVKSTASYSLAGVTATPVASLTAKLNNVSIVKSSPQHSESGRTTISGASTGTSTGLKQQQQQQQHLVAKQRAGGFVSYPNSNSNSNNYSNSPNNSGKSQQQYNQNVGEQILPTGNSIMFANNHNNNNSSISTNNNNRYSHCVSPSYSCCQKNEMLMKVNEELLQQNREFEERNHGLSEEIQVSRRFYQGTLADLTAQLSLGMCSFYFLH